MTYPIMVPIITPTNGQKKQPQPMMRRVGFKTAVSYAYISLMSVYDMEDPFVDVNGSGYSHGPAD
jgi:hypothetical protein